MFKNKIIDSTCPQLSGDINLWYSGQKDLNLRAIQLIYFQTPDMVEHQKMRIRFSRKKRIWICPLVTVLIYL